MYYTKFLPVCIHNNNLDFYRRPCTPRKNFTFLPLFMIHLKQYFAYASLCILTSWTFIYIWWRSKDTTTIQNSTWKCKGEGASQICEFTNFCVDSTHGPFIIQQTSKASMPPRINMMNADEHIWFQPKIMSHAINAIHINETVFVYGLYSPFHFSHFLYNGLMPLYSTMKEYNAPSTSWTMRVATQWNKHKKADLVLPSAQDIVLEKADVLTRKQVLPGYKPMCFAKAVVGTGNRCSLWHCDTQIPSTHYASFKKYVLDQQPTTNNTCLNSIVTYKSTGKYKIGILNRKHTRHITNIPELINQLMQQGDEYAIKTIDFDQPGCDMIHTARAVKDLDILIAPFGNGLGSGLFMKDDAVLISISARYYNEDWFKYPMTAIGRRIFNFECRFTTCQEYDPLLATSILSQFGVSLNTTEMQQFMTEKYPHFLATYLPGKEYHPIYQYQKDVKRRVDVEKFIPYLKQVMESKPQVGISYPETCNKENVCCDTDCGGPLGRNIFGENHAWKKDV